MIQHALRMRTLQTTIWGLVLPRLFGTMPDVIAFLLFAFHSALPKKRLYFDIYISKYIRIYNAKRLVV